jgi:hypothetical protein
MLFTRLVGRPQAVKSGSMAVLELGKAVHAKSRRRVDGIHIAAAPVGCIEFSSCSGDELPFDALR